MRVRFCVRCGTRFLQTQALLREVGHPDYCSKECWVVDHGGADQLEIGLDDPRTLPDWGRTLG